MTRWITSSGRARLAMLLLGLGFLGIVQATALCRSDATIQIYAASSLSEALLEAARDFEALPGGATVSPSFGSSATLATQIVEGAPISVFVSANEDQMLRVVTAGRIGTYSAVATNSLVVASVSSRVLAFKDLGEPGVRLVIGAPDVPIGVYAREAIANAERSGEFGPGFERRVIANVRSEEANAGAVMAKLQLGEADAAIVYATDLLNRPGLGTIAIESRFNVTAHYFVGLIGGSSDGAHRFVDFLLGPKGLAILAKHGFGPP